MQRVAQGLRQQHRLPSVSGTVGHAFALSSARSQSLPQSSFVGCLRNFQVDAKPLDSPSAHVAVRPCVAGPLEKGIYFSQEGGRVTLGEEPWEEGL